MFKRVSSTNHFFRLLNNYQYFIIFFVSISLSYLSIYNTVPNKDGLLYLSTAQTFLSQGFQAALAQYHWPAYALLIASTSKLTQFTLLNSAYLINAILQAVICLAFFKLAEKIYSEKKDFSKIAILCALVLFFIFPQFNEYRHYIIRDYGFWAFSLLAILNLINFCNYRNNTDNTLNHISKHTSNSKYVFFYYLGFGLAFLFRAEALVMALVLPVSILGLDYPRAIKKHLLFTLYKPVILCGIAILSLAILAYFFSNSGEHNLYHSLYINLHFNKIDQIVSTYTLNYNALNTSVFTITPISRLSAILFFGLGLFGVFLIKLINAFNVINCALLIGFFRVFSCPTRKKELHSININNLKIVLFSAMLFLCLPLGFLYIIFVTAGRYYILPCLLLILLLPIGLHYLYSKLKSLSFYPKIKFLITSGTAVIMLLMGVSGLVSFGYSKDYLPQAAEWYQNHNLPQDSRAISNHSQLKYLAKLSLPHKEHLNLESSTPYQYILLKVKAKDSATWRKIANLEINKQIIVLNTFHNERQDSVFIIKKLRNS